MWTSWLERTLGAHDDADYAARRASRPVLGEMEAALPCEARSDQAPRRTSTPVEMRC